MSKNFFTYFPDNKGFWTILYEEKWHKSLSLLQDRNGRLVQTFEKRVFRILFRAKWIDLYARFAHCHSLSYHFLLFSTNCQRWAMTVWYLDIHSAFVLNIETTSTSCMAVLIIHWSASVKWASSDQKFFQMHVQEQTMSIILYCNFCTMCIW